MRQKHVIRGIHVDDRLEETVETKLMTFDNPSVPEA